MSTFSIHQPPSSKPSIGGTPCPVPDCAGTYPSSTASDDKRERFPGHSVPGAEALLQLLITQDGSTTRLCEALASDRVKVRLLSQRVTDNVPFQVRQLLPGDLFIERITSLTARGEVLTDNLVFVALDGVDAVLRAQLQTGVRPIGHLIAGRWMCRDMVDVGHDVLDLLWRAVGEADPGAMRNYCLRAPAGPAMLICETFRGGLWNQASNLRDAAHKPPRQVA